MSEPNFDLASKIDLHPTHLHIVQEILRRRLPSQEVWAFGSRTNGTAKPYSDLDLAVMTSLPMDLSLLASLSDDFSESNLPFKVDVVDWATTSEAFRAIISQDKLVMVKR